MHTVTTTEGCSHIAAPRAEIGLVYHHDRRAIFLGNLSERHTRDGHHAVFTDFGNHTSNQFTNGGITS